MEMQVGHKETAGIAAQIAETVNIVTQHLHDAIEMVNRPGASIPSTREAVVQVAAAFAELATLQVAQDVQAQMLLARIDGGTLQDVSDDLGHGLVQTCKNMSDPTATDEHGNTFPVGALSRHYQEQLASSYSQAIISVDTIIAAKELRDEVEEFLGDNVDIVGLDEDVLGEEPPVFRSPTFTAHSGQSSRAG
jgi:hypothetical protein